MTSPPEEFASSSSAHQPSSAPPLRIGILVNKLEQAAWVGELLAAVHAAPVTELSLVILNEPPPEARTEPTLPHRLKRWIENRSNLLYSFYTAADRRRAGRPGDLFRPTDLRPQLEGVPVQTVRPRRTKHCDYFEEAEVDRIREHDLDVALRFGFRILKGDALRIARYGVWSYHHGDNRRYRGGPACFWEVAEASPVTGAVLQVLTDQLDGGRVLRRTYARTEQCSVHANKRNNYWKASRVLMHTLEELHAGRLDTGASNGMAYEPYGRRLYRMPTNREMVPFLTSQLARRARNVSRRAMAIDQWCLGLKRYPASGENGMVPRTSFYNFELIVPPKDRFWADPFPIQHDGGRFVFLEEYEYRRRRGHLSVMEVHDDGSWSTPKKVLERPYHLAYPFLFRWEEELFMIPETSQNRTVELYRCVSFPGDWRLERVLLNDIMAVDATLERIGDLWWMFANVAEPGAPDWDDALHLYHAPEPFGPWTPHPHNPVRTDVRNSRPAGRLFRSGGRLYRPAQDCSRSYGYAIALNEVVRCDPDRFEERETSRILPEWTPNLRGTHTLNAIPGLTVIDGLRTRSRFH